MVKRALLVHNNKFLDTSFQALCATKDDVARLKALLGEDYVGFDPENIKELENPTLPDFRAAVLRFFRDAERDDYLFFYYAGHGLRNKSGELHLALRTTTWDDFEALALNAGFIRAQLQGSMAEQKVVVLDCCNAGAFREDDRFISRGADFDPGLINNAFDPQGTGTYVLGASQSGASAYETVGEDGKPYSLFTDAFIEGVQTGKAAPGREMINLVDISKFIHSRRNDKGQPTQPYFDVTNAAGLLDFAQNPHPGEISNKPTFVPVYETTREKLWQEFTRYRKHLLALVAAVAVAAASYTGYRYYYSIYYPKAISGAGMVWQSKGAYPDVPGVVILTCRLSGGTTENCNEQERLKSCTNALPLLCVSRANNNIEPWPGRFVVSEDWSGAFAKLTKPLIPPAKLSDANWLCGYYFGRNYRAAEFHDSLGLIDNDKTALENARNSGWSFEAIADIQPDDGQFWVDIDKNRNAVCWDQDVAKN